MKKQVRKVAFIENHIEGNIFLNAFQRSPDDDDYIPKPLLLEFPKLKQVTICHFNFKWLVEWGHAKNCEMNGNTQACFRMVKNIKEEPFDPMQTGMYETMDAFMKRVSAGNYGQMDHIDWKGMDWHMAKICYDKVVDMKWNCPTVQQTTERARQIKAGRIMKKDEAAA